jgi:galactonate dehydratase
VSGRVRSIEAFIVTLPRDTPYLGNLRPGEEVNAQGYFVRLGNRTVYASVDRTVVVRVLTEDGVEGWGETYGLAAPRATTEIIKDLLASFVIGRDPLDAPAIHDDLYDLMRVRGYTGGYYLDALAAIDTALWDAAGKTVGLPISKLVGGGARRSTIPAYVSGLPRPTRAERAAFAAEWLAKGFSAFKFASPVADDGVAAEMESLREALGAEARIACDMHWTQSADEAVALIRAMERFGLWFAEAPVRTEDINGLARVARSVTTAIAVGEEWRTVFDAAQRIDREACAIVQPEMGHAGITEFMRIGQYAQAHHLRVMPHATIGLGIFLAASLQASAALGPVVCHEYQHSIFEPNRRYLVGDMDCRNGEYVVPTGAGLGIEPSEEARRLFEAA